MAQASTISRSREKTIAFLRSLTRRYYEEHRVSLPPDYPMREFAAQLWGGKGYVRHMSFGSEHSVHEFLVRRAPRHFYYSSARYDQPGLDDMDAKGWRSADLTFDIDADHLPQCSGKVAKAYSVIEDKEESITPDECIRMAGFEALKLYDALVEELGFEPSRISVEFSGHRGFHVNVYLSDADERARAGQEYRREIVNYLRALGVREETLEPWRLLPAASRGRRRGAAAVKPVPPLTWMAGLRGRQARIAARLLRLRGLGDLARLLEQRSLAAVLRVFENPPEALREALEKASEMLSIDVDEQVTVDTRRLVRPVGSINGKTGLLVVRIDPEDAPSFTPRPEHSGFQGDHARVKVLASLPTLSLLGFKLRLREGDRVKLPLPLAGYLMAKGLAVLDTA